MTLSKRLAQVVITPANRGCKTCLWLAGLSPADRTAFDDWLTAGHSKSQLWEICTTDDPPLNISLTGFRAHMKHHQIR